ncbi:MAG: peroxiredoxin-like family protein, partial [Gammaproteobacteria bacterium]
FFRDQDLKIYYLKDLLNENNIVLSFFRGAWCPYCDLELKALAEIHGQIKAKGARLIAVSPELYQFTKDAIEKHKIDYPVYTDLGNKAADEFGLVFELPPKLRDIHKILNIHLNVLNGEPSWTLPVPATFIISKQGIIESTYINADYTSRMEPEDILKVLDTLPS